MVRVMGSAAKSAQDLEGFDYPLPGRYHVMIDKADETFTKSQNSVIIDFSILAGSTGASQSSPLGTQVGKKVREYFSMSEKAQKRLWKLALATGMVTEQQLGTDVELDFTGNGVGRQLVIEVEPNEYEKDGEKKTGIRVAFLGMHSVFDPDVKDVPKDQGALALLGGAAPAQANSHQATPARATQAAPAYSPPQTAAPAAAASPYAGL